MEVFSFHENILESPMSDLRDLERILKGYHMDFRQNSYGRFIDFI